MTAFAYLLHLKKVCKKICFKKYHFVEQSLYELKAEETEVAKTGSIPSAVETTGILKVVSPAFKVYWLPLTNLFVFDLFFFQLPDLLFYNTP